MAIFGPKLSRKDGLRDERNELWLTHTHFSRLSLSPSPSLRMTSKKKKSTSSNTRAAKKQRRADPPKLEIQLPPEVLTCAQFAGARRVAAQQKLIHAELPQTVKQAYTVTLSGGGDSVSFYSIPRGAEQPDGWLSYNSGQMWHLHEKIQRAVRECTARTHCTSAAQP